MAKKKEEKGKNVGDPQLVAAQIMSAPNLMEVEIKFSRDGEMQIKAMLDEPGGTNIIFKVFEDDLLVHDVSKVVPLDPNLGTGPAGDEFDSIQLRGVK